MNTDEFISLLQNPKEVSKIHTSELKDIVDKYPFFQSARALYLKGLKQNESLRYNQELKTTAAHTTDRSILFDFITSEEFNQNDISEIIKKNSESLKDIEVNDLEDISVNKSVAIDEALKEQIKSTEGVLDPQLFQQKIRTSDIAQLTSEEKAPIEQVILDVDTKHIEKTPEETLQIGKPLEFDKNEKHSFSEWLKIANFKPIDRSQDEKMTKIEAPSEEISQKTEQPLEQKYPIIDKFLSANPKIVPSKEVTRKEPQLVQEVPHDGLMTETLARIYLEQNNYTKAIQSYKILSLKYPEKSGLFADQIKAVEKLQETNGKK